MQRRHGGVYAIVALLVCTASITSAPQRAYAACPNPSEREATAADIPLMKAAGYPDDYQVVGRCWNPTSKFIGEDVAQAKQYLRSILCKGSNFGGAGPDGTVFGVNGNGGLDAQFAQCAAKFLKAMSTQLEGQLPLYNGGTNSVCLREGYRTPETQQKYYREYQNGGGIACGKNGVERCEHPRGIAIDVNTTSEANYQRMWNAGAQYGVNFYLRARDKVHFVPLNNGCSGGGFTAIAPVGGIPTGGTSNPSGLLPKSFYDFPQYAPATAPQSPTPFSTPLNALQPYQDPQPTYTQPSTYQTVNEPIVQPSATTSSYTEYSFPTTTTTYTVATSGPRASDQIELLAGGTGTSQNAPTSTSSPTQLNDDLNDIGPTNTGGTNFTDEVPDGTLALNSVAVNPIHVTETFTGTQPTNVQNASSGAQATANRTIIIALLTTLRDMLASFVQILKSRPSYGFQAPWQVQSTTNTYR